MGNATFDRGDTVNPNDYINLDVSDMKNGRPVGLNMSVHMKGLCGRPNQDVILDIRGSATLEIPALDSDFSDDTYCLSDMEDLLSMGYYSGLNTPKNSGFVDCTVNGQHMEDSGIDMKHSYSLSRDRAEFTLDGDTARVSLYIDNPRTGQIPVMRTSFSFISNTNPGCSYLAEGNSKGFVVDGGVPGQPIFNGFLQGTADLNLFASPASPQCPKVHLQCKFGAVVCR